MGKTVDPKSFDSIRNAAGLLLFIGLIAGAFFNWLRPFEIPLIPEARFGLALGTEVISLMLFSRFFLKNRGNKVTVAGILVFSGVAFLFSSLNGLLVNSNNFMLYLLPVLWISSYVSWVKAIMADLLIMAPEFLLWLNLSQKWWWHPPVSLLEPRLKDFNWQAFWTEYGIMFFSFLVLTILTTQRRKRTGFRSSNIQHPQNTPKKPETEESETMAIKAGSASSSASGDSLDRARFEEEAAGLRGILESIVFFMSKNFKAQSALGFLSLDEGHTFVVNAKFSCSQYFKDNVLVYRGSGIVGKAIDEPNGFMTGSVKTYPDKVEYYSRLEEVNSIIVTRIMDEESRKVSGLLVVDSASIRGFDDSDKELLLRFSAVASKLISNARMRRVLENSSAQNEIIYNISKQLVAENTVRGVLGVLIENLRKVFVADRMIVCGYDEKSGKGVIIRMIGEPSEDIKQGDFFEIDDPKSLYAMVFKHQIEYLESDICRENRYRFSAQESSEHEPLEVMVGPVFDGHKNVVAVLGLESLRSGIFHKRSIVLFRTILANASSSIERAKVYQELKRQAQFDGLTRIPNHRTFQDTLDRLISQAQQNKKNFGLLLMDIDHFKNFNDTYGHPVGDKVLQLVARTIAHTIRPSQDFVARYGGEEFVVLLDMNPNQLAQAAERVRAAIEQQVLPYEGEQLRVTVSIGVAAYPLDAELKKDLVECADQAMYSSKKNGRNRVTLWSQVFKGSN